VVVVLMGAAGDGAAVIAHMLGADVGWPVAEWPAPGAIRAMVARTLGRREHLIIASSPLSPDDQQSVRGDLHGVRFVDLSVRRDSPAEIVAALRRDFGL
jgi:hypothetical protein